MKSFRATLFFAVVVLGLGGYSLWEYKKSQQETEAKAAEGAAITLKAEEVTEVRLKNSNGTVMIVKENDHWLMKEPVVDRVDSVVLEDWLNSLSQQKIKDLSKQVEGSIDWSKFYISEQSMEVEVKTAHAVEKLSFGTSNAFDGSYYLRKGDNLYLGEASWARLLNRPANDFRDKKIFDPLAAVEAIRIDRTGKKPVELNKKGEEWIAKGQNDLRLSSSQINSFLTDLQEVQAQEIVANESTPATLKQFNLVSKSNEIALKVKDVAEPVVLKISPTEKVQDVTVVRSGKPFIYKMPKVNLDRVLVGLDYFRDGKDVLKMDWQSADRLVYSHNKQKIELLLKDGNWQAVEVPDGKEFKAENTKGLLNQLSQLEAVAYPAATKVSGDFIEAFKGQERLARLDIGAEFASTETLAIHNPLLYVLSSKSKQVVGVQKANIERLWQTLPVVDKAPQPPAEPESFGEDQHGHEH